MFQTPERRPCEVKLIDFGLATMYLSNEYKNMSEKVGTIYTMAPQGTSATDNLIPFKKCRLLCANCCAVVRKLPQPSLFLLSTVLQGVYDLKCDMVSRSTEYFVSSAQKRQLYFRCSQTHLCSGRSGSLLTFY